MPQLSKGFWKENIQRFNNQQIQALKQIKKDEENITTQRRRWINNEIDRLEKENSQLEDDNE